MKNGEHYVVHLKISNTSIPPLSPSVDLGKCRCSWPASWFHWVTSPAGTGGGNKNQIDGEQEEMARTGDFSLIYPNPMGRTV